ncbi:MAG: helix-turn-helix transcriptional regulator [Eubacterium sp.]|nr:helix-turn-helix transcriptional regulator [Eubacterium sp.]
MEELRISLAAARVNAEMTQEEAASKMGVTKATIINWEKGRIVPGIPEIEMLAKIYNIKQDYIFLPCYSTKSRN